MRYGPPLADACALSSASIPFAARNSFDLKVGLRSRRARNVGSHRNRSSSADFERPQPVLTALRSVARVNDIINVDELSFSAKSCHQRMTGKAEVHVGVSPAHPKEVK